MNAAGAGGGHTGPYWRRQYGTTLPGEQTAAELAATNAQRARLGLPPLGGPAQINPASPIPRPPAQAPLRYATPAQPYPLNPLQLPQPGAPPAPDLLRQAMPGFPAPPVNKVAQPLYGHKPVRRIGPPMPMQGPQNAALLRRFLLGD